ncbi:MAG TPA: hypothetical protein PLF78_07425 [Caulobacter sp.]|nr:hypothetical protein [Caulobacter sp.]
MEMMIGVALALGVGGFAMLSGFDKDRAFYPTVAIVVAAYYLLFAAMTGRGAIVLAETLVMAGFAAIAVIGFRGDPWFTVLALGGHGVLDLAHPRLIANPAAPDWWPAFCLAFDVTIAGWLAARLLREGRA